MAALLEGSLNQIGIKICMLATLKGLIETKYI